MAYTVFYSWQSDCPNCTNRTFIEDALKEAIREVSKDFSVINAERDGSIELDKDTQGVSGTPPITDVIFEKISGATVFVPDLTMVGKTEKNRLVSNPNVLIEYGWALCALGHSRILPIMNTAYGNATEANLPFNMRHLRHPISFELQEQVGAEEKKRVKANFVKQLVSAISLILETNSSKARQKSTRHVAINSTEDPSTFLKKDESLGIIGGGHREEQKLVVPDNEHLFLRVIPQNLLLEIDSSQKVLELLKNDLSQPITSQACGWNQGRNQYGAFTVSHDQGKVLCLTQVFHNREIWGIDADIIDKNGLMNWMNVEFGYFPCSGLENWFIQTLSTYLPFCRDILKLSPPLKFIAGATRVEGYKMTAPNGMRFDQFEKFGGRVVVEHIVHEGDISDYNIVSTVILRPFFEKIWEECGLKRPDQEQL